MRGSQLRAFYARLVATATEINQALSGISNTVTRDNLDALTGSGETTLHSHPAGGVAASAVTYDPTASGLSGTDVQAAIDEVAASAGGGGVQIFGPTTITAADWLDLHNTPKVLVAAQGVGRRIVPVGLLGVPSTGTAYEGAGDLEVAIGSRDWGYWTDIKGALNGGALLSGPGGGQGGAAFEGQPADSLDNQPLVARIFGDGLTVGDRTLDVWVAAFIA